ncbi:hypothetical protein HIM_00543 [Hirsutella minnesotensis 3608]|nr:hypothetical protein HIM_00543 [Hirsutella minnesotensis 3608]
MAHAQSHAQRSGAPHLGPQIGALDHYSTSPRSFRRASEHLSRSPAFPTGGASRRHHFTSSQGSLNGFASPAAARMDPGYGNRSNSGKAPPLQPVQMLGQLCYTDAAMTPVKVEIRGLVDKGPFLSNDQEWTCYRRNYLSCQCSYALSPMYFPNVPIQFTPSSSSQASMSAQTFQVYGFAMCISAVVAENEQQHIELVQHTPKRDKGPISKPTKVPMVPKLGNSSHHAMGTYGDGGAVPGTRGLYPDGHGGTQANGQHYVNEHSFDRIQFKSATLNNGKRRAAQQYYHLIVELWADVGAHNPEQYVKVAYRKSAKMIVRGRSPGHYQNERRASQGNAQTGSASTLNGYTGMGHLTDFTNSSTMLGGPGPGGYATTYDSRNGIFSGARQPEIPEEAIMAPDDGKTMETSKAYYHYPGPMYDGHHERNDMFSQRSGPESVIPSMAQDTKIKNEYDFSMLPRPYGTNMPNSRVGEQRQHDHFDGKGTSSGYYPSIMASTGIHLTMA